MPFTALIFSDCIEEDIATILALMEQEAPVRYSEGIIRNICEQVIEFIYLYQNQALLPEHYGINRSKEDLAELSNEPNLFKRIRKLVGDKRYSQTRNIHDMAVKIGEEVGTDDEMSLYEAYQYVSTVYHNSYRESFMDLFGTVSEMMDKATKTSHTNDSDDSGYTRLNEVDELNALDEPDEMEESDELEEPDEMDGDDVDYLVLTVILTRFMEVYQEIVKTEV